MWILAGPAIDDITAGRIVLVMIVIGAILAVIAIVIICLAFNWLRERFPRSSTSNKSRVDSDDPV